MVINFTFHTLYSFYILDLYQKIKTIILYWSCQSVWKYGNFPYWTLYTPEVLNKICDHLFLLSKTLLHFSRLTPFRLHVFFTIKNNWAETQNVYSFISLI